MNSEDAPNTVSDPNHVAKRADELRRMGRLRPASMKSPDVFTLLEAQYPIRMVMSRYRMIEKRSNYFRP
jgi:hypothetical protein